MNNKKQKLFTGQLRGVSFWSYILKLLPIPFQLVLAKIMADVVSSATQGETRAVLSCTVAILAFVIVYKGGLAALEIFYERKKSQVLHQCKIRLYYQFLSNPLSVLYASGHGKNMEKLNDDFDTLTNHRINACPDAWASILSVAAYTAFLFVRSKWMALALAVMSLIQLVPPLIVKRFLEINYERCREVEAELTDYTVEAYRGFATIKLNKLQTWWLERLKKLHKRYEKVGNASIMTNQTEIALHALTDNILKYGAYAVVGAFVLFQVTPLEAGIEAIALSGSLFQSVNRLSAVIPNLAIHKKAIERLSEWFQYRERAEGKIDRYRIALSGVRFQSGKKLILKDVNAIFSGSKITLIKGENGSGKSTLLRLMAGLLECSGGEVRIDGFAPEELAEMNFPKAFFYLPQTDVAFNFTAKELYEMVLPDNSEKLRAVCSQFHLTEQTLGETKIKDLSGGERKKVFLSLAFALNPTILFLDEPTNSLDENSKSVLCSLLKELSGHAVLVSHDDVFDNLAEQVYQVEKGAVRLER